MLLVASILTVNYTGVSEPAGVWKINKL